MEDWVGRPCRMHEIREIVGKLKRREPLRYIYVCRCEDNIKMNI